MSDITLFDPPITAKMVLELRAATQQPMMLCKKALVNCKGDFEKAKEYLMNDSFANTTRLVTVRREPEWITNLRREVLMSKATHTFSFTRDELIELLKL